MEVFKLRDYSSDDRVTNTTDLLLLHRTLPWGVAGRKRALRLRELSGLQLCLPVSTGAHHSGQGAGWS